MTTATARAASPTKLRSGAWGATVSGSVSVGDVIRITSRAGKSWDATVSQVVWTGGGKSIVATESQSSGRSSGYTPATRNSRGYVEQRGHYDGYCGYACPVSGRKCSPANGPCHDCQ